MTEEKTAYEDGPAAKYLKAKYDFETWRIDQPIQSK